MRRRTMSFLAKLEKQAEKVANFKADMPVNALATMMPSDGVPFMAKYDVQPMLVIEQYDEDSGFKSTYYVDAEIAESLPKKKVATKMLHVLQTQKDDIRLVLLSRKPSNSWNRSKLDLVKASDEGKVISVKRDKEAGVYGYSIEHDIKAFDIDMTLVDKKLEEVFSGEFYIDSLDHPVAKKLQEDDGEVVDVTDVVDDKQPEEVKNLVDADDKADNKSAIKPEYLMNGDCSDYELVADFDDDISLDDSDDIEIDFDDIDDLTA